MKNVVRVFLAVLTFALVSTTWSFAEGAADMYKSKCAVCHGATGAGDTAMGKSMKIRDLGSADVQKQSDAELATIIGTGKGKMPGYESKGVTKDQINDLVKYIRTLKK